MSVYKARETRRNTFLWWLRQRCLDIAEWAAEQVDYEDIDKPGATYTCRYTFFNARTGEETPVSPVPGLVFDEADAPRPKAPEI